MGCENEGGRQEVVSVSYRPDRVVIVSIEVIALALSE
jgi:hypothetical protein